MREYLYAWICVAVLAALAEVMLPMGLHSKTSGSVRFIMGLCMILALCPMAKEGIERLRSIGDISVYAYEADGDDLASTSYFHAYLSEMTTDTCRSWVLETMASRFGVPDTLCEVGVEVNVDEDGVPQIMEVRICLYGKEIFKDPHEIEAYFSEALSVPCVVSVGMKKA